MLRKLSIVFCLLLSVLVAFGQKSKKPTEKALITTAKTDYKETGAPLPDLKFFSKDGRYMRNNDLKNDAHLFLMLFNPTCEHCEEQTGIFKENIGLFKRSRLILVAAPNMLPHLEYFINNTRLNKFKGIELAVDSSGYIEQTFKYVTLPQINIYDRDRKLVKIFVGPTAIDSLKGYID